MITGKTLPTELHLYQCERCHGVVEYPSADLYKRHLKPVEDYDPHDPWCTGEQVQFTYRLVTKSDYTLRA